MEHEEYQIMHDVEETYWWHVGRRNILRQILQLYFKTPVDKIVDVGCGTGSDYKLLKDFGKTILGFDISDEALSYCRSHGWKTVSQIYPGAPLPLEDNSVDLITLLDVVEHAEKDTTMLRDVFRILKPEGTAVITVPAYGWLWSEHDEALHHYRRYTLKRFVRQLRSVGFDVHLSSYIIVFSFPMVIIFRLLSGMRNLLSRRTTSESETSYVFLPKPLNNFFTRLLTWEGRALRWIRFPFGTSLLVVARRPNHANKKTP